MQSISTPLFNLHRPLGMALIVIAAFLLALLPSARPAQADPGFAYYWSLTWDFESNANGRLRVVVGHNEDGAPQEPPLYVQETTVPCKRVGNATVAGGLLKLNGGYLACELDVKAALERAFAVCASRVPGCTVAIDDNELYNHFRMTTEVLATNPGEAPIFYHPDASISVNVQSSTAQITGAVSPHGVIPSSSVVVFPALGVLRSYEAFYSCQGGCDMDYTVGAMQQTVATGNAQASFYTPATEIFIGFHPVTGLVAPAGTDIASLVVDPPNHGND